MSTHPIFTTQKNSGANNRTVFVDSIEGFPDPVAGVITLETDVTYVMLKDITTSNRFEIPTGSESYIICWPAETYTLTYTGSETLFTGVNVGSFNLQYLTVIAPSGKIIDINGATQVLLITTLFLNFATFGDVKNVTGVLFVDACAFLLGDQGLVVDDLAAFIINRCNFASWDNNSGTFIRYNSGTFTSTLIALNNFAPGSTENVLYIEPTATYGNAQIVGNSYTNVGSFYESGSLDETDPNWKVVGNGFVKDSGTFGTAFFVGNTTETVINAINTPVPIAGTTSPSSTLERITHSSPNLTYVGLEDAVLRVEAYVTVQVTQELETDDIRVYIYVDGVQFPATVASKTLGTVFQDPTVDFLAAGDVNVQNGQVIEARIENRSTTTNILISEYRLLVRE